MAADGSMLQGEVNDNPTQPREQKETELLLQGLLNALVEEQKTKERR